MGCNWAVIGSCYVAPPRPAPPAPPRYSPLRDTTGPPCTAPPGYAPVHRRTASTPPRGAPPRFHPTPAPPRSMLERRPPRTCVDGRFFISHGSLPETLLNIERGGAGANAAFCALLRWAFISHLPVVARDTFSALQPAMATRVHSHSAETLWRMIQHRQHS